MQHIESIVGEYTNLSISVLGNLGIIDSKKENTLFLPKSDQPKKNNELCCTYPVGGLLQCSLVAPQKRERKQHAFTKCCG